MGMPLFTGAVGGGYSRRHMPQPKSGDGPWGAAIRYWLNRRGMQQADLVRTIKALNGTTTPNTLSTAIRGFDCSTRTLRIIAAALKVSLDEVLVSPDKKSDVEARKAFVAEVAERVVRDLEHVPRPAPPVPTLNEAMQQLHRATQVEKENERLRGSREKKQRGNRKK